MTGLSGLSNGLQAAGAAMQVVGAWYAARANKYNLKSQASNFDFRARMAKVSARQGELDAQATVAGAQQAAALSDLRYGQILGQSRSRQAASGIQRGVGSAAEVQASIKFAQQSDRYSITVNGVRASNQQRAASVDQLNQGTLLRASASNLRRTAGGISPWMAAMTSLLGAGSQIAASQAEQERFRIRFGGSSQ